MGFEHLDCEGVQLFSLGCNCIGRSIGGEMGNDVRVGHAVLIFQVPDEKCNQGHGFFFLRRRGISVNQDCDVKRRS